MICFIFYVQALQTDILKHSHDHDNLNREGQSLIGLVDTDKNHVTDTLFDANKRWENLSQGNYSTDMSLYASKYTCYAVVKQKILM